MRYLDFYKASILFGHMPTKSLCIRFNGKEEYEIIRPNETEKEALSSELKCSVAWGSDAFTDRPYELTALRMNILLLCAAQKGEFDRT